MKQLITVIFCSIFFYVFEGMSQTPAQQKGSTKSLTRVIKFIDLRDSANTPYWGYYRELPRLIMKAIEKGSIKSYYLDYTKKNNITELTKDEYVRHIIFPNPSHPDFFSGDLLFASEMPYVGLDQTISIVDGKECVHVHYVNFYSNENLSEDKKTRQYRFSVTWQDFIKVLKERSDLLYAPNTFGTWWRGNVFITNERYFLESPTANFIELSRKKNVFPKSFNGQYYMRTVDSLNKKMYDPSLMDIYFIEERMKDQWKIKRLAFGTLPEQQSYDKEVRFLYEWPDFVGVLNKNGSDITRNIYTLADAFLLKKFQYSDKIKAVQIYKKYKPKKAKKTSMYSDVFAESFNSDVQPIADTMFHTQLLENIYLEDTCNKQLNIAGHSLAERIYEYALNDVIDVYEYDSLNSVISNSTFRSNASEYLDIEQIEYEKVYETGDTISISNYYSYRTEYYIVKENFNGSDFYADSTLLNKVATRYLPPLYSISTLNVIELYQHLTFDSEGNNKNYQLEAVALHVSADAPTNIRGIQYPICFVRWNDLKSLLLKDPKAYFIYENRKINLVELLENREFLSSFYKTGYVERGE